MSLLRQVEHEEMGTGRMVPTLLLLAWPTAVSGILRSLFGVVDTLFISWLGKTEVSGVFTAFPLSFMVMALGSAAGIGVNALVSRHLGAGEPQAARRVLDNALVISLACGATVALFGGIFARELLWLTRARGDILEAASSYFSIAIIGSVFLHVGIVGDSALRAQGNTLTPMKVAMLSNLLNMILDPLFIFGKGNALPGPAWIGGAGLWGWLTKMMSGLGIDVDVREVVVALWAHLTQFLSDYGLGMGVRGAALATLLAHGLMTVVLLQRLWSKRCRLRPSPPWQCFAQLRLRTMAHVYGVGLPITVSHFGMAVSAFLTNLILMPINPAAVGVLGIATRLQMLAFVPIFGLFSAVLTMVAYNLGLQKIRRCKGIIYASCAIAAILMGLAGGGLTLFPEAFMKLFSTDQEVIRIGVQLLRIQCWAFAIAGIDIMLSGGFQGFGKTHYSMFCQLWRTLIVKVPVAYVLARYWGLAGVWWSFPISTIACLVVSVWLMWVLFIKIREHYGPDPDGVVIDRTGDFPAVGS